MEVYEYYSTTNTQSRVRAGDRFERQILNLLKQSGYPDARISDDPYSYWDIEVVPGELYIEAKSRTHSFYKYDSQLMPVSKLEYLSKQTYQTIIMTKHIDGEVWYLHTYPNISRLRLRKIRAGDVYTDSYEIPNRYFKRLHSNQEIVNLCTRRRN